ncbi:MAG: hypothetical protein GQ540_08220 [Lutibacter sp.]|uniref:hypothetical protein n=1 Tax=Lutibacter sp. TaxID=1925666 RepID=UPI0019D9070C|nr:hypothetical protein [Lutibacter sp.]NOR28498.1 hypothetical protein [Lutibacter sp.]
MKNIIFLTLTFFLFFSCSKQSELHKKYNCSSSKISNSKTIKDFNKNFRLTISNDWKSNFYFNKFQSEIFSADTTKQLTDSFILGTSFNQGIINFNSNFHQEKDSILTVNHLELTDSGEQLFLSKPSYWYVAKGMKNGYTYHQFNSTIKLSENTYFVGYSEIYGDTNINERICETISILEKIEFLE